MDVDLLSPLFFVAAGGLGLAFRAGLHTWKADRSALAEREAQLIQRFDNRSRVSWVLVGVGILWLAQIVLERRLEVAVEPTVPRSFAFSDALILSQLFTQA